MNFLYLFCQFLRVLLAPFLALVAPKTPLLKERWEFEQKNKTDSSGFYRSFAQDQLIADRTYQVSSEGEWEQLWAFVVADMNEQLRVELIYTSDSLERRVQLAMSSCQTKHIRFFRLPVLSYFPWKIGPWQNINHWATAHELVLCRYDFYPELMLRGLKMKRFVLVSASLKSKEDLLRREGSALFHFYQKQYRLFERVLLASSKEKTRFSKLQISAPLWAYEARGLQISLRLKNAQATFHQRKVEALVQAIEKRPFKGRLIFGSAWEEDLQMLHSLSANDLAQCSVVIAPHVLDREKIFSMQKQMGSKFEHFLFDGHQTQQQVTEAFEQGLCVWVALPGLLLELYTLFPFVFVGGGFGRSVHSVLEPYLAGAFIFCGPKIHRSTEVEVVQMDQCQSLQVIDSPLAFATAWKLQQQIHLAAPKFISYYEELYEKELQSFQKARLFFLGHYPGEQ